MLPCQSGRSLQWHAPFADPGPMTMCRRRPAVSSDAPSCENSSCWHRLRHRLRTAPQNTAAAKSANHLGFEGQGDNSKTRITTYNHSSQQIPEKCGSIHGRINKNISKQSYPKNHWMYPHYSSPLTISPPYHGPISQPVQVIPIALGPGPGHWETESLCNSAPAVL